MRLGSLRVVATLALSLPARTIGDIRRVRTVVKGGAVYSSADAFKAMGIRAE